MTPEPINALLGHINAFPGVVGTMVCDDKGKVLAEVFPPHVDRAAPARAAEILSDNSSGLGGIGGPVTMLSLRFGDSRIMARPVGGGHLLVLCAPSVNPQPLTLLAAATAPKLEKIMASMAQPPAMTPPAAMTPAPVAPPPAMTPPPFPAVSAVPPPPPPVVAPPLAAVMAAMTPAPVPAPVAAPAPGKLYQMVQRIETVISRKKLDPFRTRGAISMAAGFGLRCIDIDTPDDQAMLSKLEAAATTVLGEKP
jgi:predicted regulator of Ras-like GTPase activity (Roadblock/LC7/MglB family)